MCTEYLALSQTVIKRTKKECAGKVHACCMKKNYDSLTCVSQQQDKCQKWRKDVLRHTPHRATAPRKSQATVKNLVYTTILHTQTILKIKWTQLPQIPEDLKAARCQLHCVGLYVLMKSNIRDDVLDDAHGIRSSRRGGIISTRFCPKQL